LLLATANAAFSLKFTCQPFKIHKAIAANSYAAALAVEGG